MEGRCHARRERSIKKILFGSENIGCGSGRRSEISGSKDYLARLSVTLRMTSLAIVPMGQTALA